MAKKDPGANLVVTPFPVDENKVAGEEDVTNQPDAQVMSKVRLTCDSDTVVVFFRRDGKLYRAPSEKTS